jgi:hypothetical protein
MADLEKSCRETGASFVVREWEQAFLDSLGLPYPTLSPLERHRRRLTHRNERRIYKRTCSYSGQPIISMYREESPLTVYAPDVWWSDVWDPKDYGQDYDFDRPFFEQYQALQQRVPRLNLLNEKSENSAFCNITTGNKNCYLVFGGDLCEDCFYSVFSMKCRDVMDVYWVNDSELVYDSVDCYSCYNVKYCQNSQNCSDSAFLFECRNVRNSFGCVGLNNVEYHIFNKPYSPEDYAQKIKSFRLDTWSGVQKMKAEFEAFRLQFPHRATHIINSERVTGDFISGTKNAENCFGVQGPAEELKDVFLGYGPITTVLSSDHVGHRFERGYELVGSIGGFNCALSTFAWNSQEVFYCDMVESSRYLFGCLNMRRAEYCILNKQYTPAEYEALLPRIIEHMKSTGEWGEFFPMWVSPFAYNETVAQDYFPLTSEDAKVRGLRWYEEERLDQSSPVLPDSIHDVTDDILQQTLICELEQRPYRLIEKELAFYRKHGVPVPRYAPETRNQVRIRQRNPIQVWERQCAKTGESVLSSYAPNRPETIYSEAAYRAEFY